MLRARELLAAGLDVGASHRVRRVREDVAAFDELACGLPPGPRRVVALLRKHGRRPPAASERETIARAVADSFAETSYEYPWNGLEDDLRALGVSSLRLFAFGSLINRESASRDFSDAGARSVPVLAFGVVRLFEYDMPDVLRAPMCFAGAETCSPAFAGLWRDTTFLGDGETTVAV